MKREFLKGLGLSDEHIESIMSEHGKTVGKANQELEEAKKNVETLNTQLKQRDTDFEALKKNADLSEEQTNKFKELQEKYESEKKEWEQKLIDNQFEAARDVAIAESGTRDVVALKAHTLNKAKELEFKDGVIVGYKEYLKEQLSGELKHLANEQKATGVNFGNPPKEDNLLEQSANAMGVRK